MSKNSCKQIGVLSGGTWDKMHDISRRVYDTEGLAPTVHTMGGGGQELKIADSVIGAIRGRNPENPSDRTAGIPLKQRLEINESGLSNALTTVQKDNVVVIQRPRGNNKGGAKEVEVIPTHYEHNTLIYDDYNGRIKVDQTTIGTIKANDGAPTPRNGQKLIETANGFRVRKLTPRECWRLMGQTDKAYDLARQALIDKHYKGRDKASSQLYKQAGNSIVVQVLEAVFDKIQGIAKDW